MQPPKNIDMVEDEVWQTFVNNCRTRGITVCDGLTSILEHYNLRFACEELKIQELENEEKELYQKIQF